MFGEDLILGYSVVSLDEKNRFHVPKKITHVEAKEELVISRGLDYLKISNLKLIQDKLNLLYATDVTDDEIITFYLEKELENIYFSTISIEKTDEQGRIVVPKIAVEEFNLSRNPVFVGAGYSGRLFANMEEYRKNIKRIR